MDNQLLTVPEVADLLKVSTRTVYIRIAAGEIPKVALGDRTTRVLRSDLDAYLAKRRVGTCS